MPIFDSYKPKIRTISAASLAGKSPKIPALFQICFEFGRLHWVLVVSPCKNWYQKPRENSKNLTLESPKQYVKFNCGCYESHKLPLRANILYDWPLVLLKMWPNNLVYQTKKTCCRKICFCASELNRPFLRSPKLIFILFPLNICVKRLEILFTIDQFWSNFSKLRV